MKPLTLHPHEIRRLLATGSVTVWRPVNRRSCANVPTWLWNRLEWDDAKVPTGAMGNCADNGYLHIACRPVEGDSPDEWTRERVYPAHPPGSERWVKERFGWAVTPKGKSVIVYQADNQARPVLCDNEGEGDCVGVEKEPVEYVAVDGLLWKAAQRMPRWASRLSVTSTAVQARQVDSLCDPDLEFEVFDTGIKGDCECCCRYGGEYAGECFECAGWGEVDGEECEHCGGEGTCQVCEGACAPSAMFASWWESQYGHWNPDEWAWVTTLTRKDEG